MQTKDLPVDTVMNEFEAYLRKQSEGCETAYMRWLEYPGGESSDGDWCTKCVEIERYRERHEKSKMTRISGWDDLFESDSIRTCENCGVMLEVSLTAYGIETEIKECLAVQDALTETEAYTFLQLFEGCGDFRIEKHWPMMLPHALRMLATN